MERACRPTSSESPATSLMDVAGLASPPSPSVGGPVLTPGWAAGELFLLAGSQDALADAWVSLPHSFYRPVQVTERCATDVVWCRWVAVTRISATPWNDLAAPPGGAFVWDPAARAVQSTVVLCLWVCRLIGKPVHVCRLSPAPNAGLFLGSCRERVCLRGGSCCSGARACGGRGQRARSCFQRDWCARFC